MDKGLDIEPDVPGRRPKKSVLFTKIVLGGNYKGNGLTYTVSY